MTTAITAFRSCGPSAAAIASARMMPGKAKTRSARRMITLSTQPPKKPAIPPSTAPMIMAAMTRMTASGSVIRAPNRTREKTSRPSSSVPNQCAQDGPARIANFCASGFCGAITGAKMPITAQDPMMISPVRASGWRQGGGASGRRRRRRTASTAAAVDDGSIGAGAETVTTA